MYIEVKITEFKRNSSQSQDPNCTLLESVCARVLQGRYIKLRLEAKVVYESKVRFFFLVHAVKYADQGDPQLVVFILHPDMHSPKLVLVSELVLNAQKDWMNHHGSEFS